MCKRRNLDSELVQGNEGKAVKRSLQSKDQEGRASMPVALGDPSSLTSAKVTKTKQTVRDGRKVFIKKRKTDTQMSMDMVKTSNINSNVIREEGELSDDEEHTIESENTNFNRKPDRSIKSGMLAGNIIVEVQGKNVEEFSQEEVAQNQDFEDNLNMNPSEAISDEELDYIDDVIEEQEVGDMETMESFLRNSKETDDSEIDFRTTQATAQAKKIEFASPEELQDYVQQIVNNTWQLKEKELIEKHKLFSLPPVKQNKNDK